MDEHGNQNRCAAVTRNGHRCDKPPHEEGDDAHEAENAAEGGATLVWIENYVDAPQGQALANALHGLWTLIEEGALVRNVTHDAEAGYAREAMRLVMALKHAQEALRAAGRLP